MANNYQVDTGHRIEVPYCEHCGVSGGQHLTTDCPGDAEALQRRIASLENHVRELEQRLREVENKC